MHNRHYRENTANGGALAMASQPTRRPAAATGELRRSPRTDAISRVPTVSSAAPAASMAENSTRKPSRAIVAAHQR